MSHREETGELDLARSLLDWSAVWMRRSLHGLNRYTRAAGLSLAQMNVLMHLHYSGSCEVMDLTELMQASPAAASQMVERMVQQGLARRAESADDRRVRRVQLSAQGRKRVEEYIAGQQKEMEALAASLTAEQRAAVALALRVLAEKAELWEGTASG